MHSDDELRDAFERLEERRSRLDTLRLHHEQLERSWFVRLRVLWHAMRTFVPLPARSRRILLTYEGVAPFAYGRAAPVESVALDAVDPLAAYFDRDYYLQKNPDVLAAGVDPYAHFIDSGAAENREAHPLFAAQWYLARYPDARGHRGGALWHYLETGRHENRDPHPAFAASAYVAATGCGFEPLLHYMRHGRPDPHPLFDGERYRAEHPGERRAPLHAYLSDASSSFRPHALFDPAFYREQQGAPRTEHPFFHYLAYGSLDGLLPNPWFDPLWYRDAYPDVAAAGVEPLTHYASSGWREGRNPSPAFSAAWYAATYPQARDMEPLAHYLTAGREAGNARTALDDPAAYQPAPPAQPARAARPVDVIVPVYRNLDVTRRCIEAVLGSELPDETRVVVIDDASPEPAVSRYVAGLQSSRIVSVRNEQNLGFVGSVNRALSLCEGRDAVLVNSDTVVAGDWLVHLRAAAYRDRVATVTPFSNNATICSFPAIGPSNPCDPGDVPLLQAAAASSNDGRAFDLPTGVGFCLYLRRDALDELGPLDDERFGRGYGEEVDFCRRAAGRGWRNVLACDAFVYHEGEVSFAADAAAGKSRAEAVIRALYPDYKDLVRRHVAADPALPARLALAIEAIRTHGGARLLFVTHALGGGIARHVQQVADELAADAVVLRLAPSAGRTVTLDAPAWPYFPRLQFAAGDDEARLRAVIDALDVERVHVHSVVGFPIDVEGFVRATARPFEFTVHDYYTLCPQITMSDEQGTYCGEPDETGCAFCIARRPTTPLLDIASWRDANAWLLRDARRVIAPSGDVAERVRRYHPDVDVTVVPHGQ